MILISLSIHREVNNTGKDMGCKFQGTGIGFSTRELNQGCVDHGTVARHQIMEGNPGKVTEKLH